MVFFCTSAPVNVLSNIFVVMPSAGAARVIAAVGNEEGKEDGDDVEGSELGNRVGEAVG